MLFCIQWNGTIFTTSPVNEYFSPRSSTNSASTRVGRKPVGSRVVRCQALRICRVVPAFWTQQNGTNSLGPAEACASQPGASVAPPLRVYAESGRVRQKEESGADPQFSIAI